MENKKNVELLGIRVVNDKAIRLVELDFEKFKDSNVIEIIGRNGAGKSTLIKAAMSAVSGAKTIKDKELLELGLTHEIKLHDGEYDVFMGFRVREVTKGVHKGEPVSENYLYTRDKNGEINNKPVIDGVSKSEDYRKMLITPLTFDMDELYLDNQTVVRKRIEQVYSADLNKLGVEEVRARISDARKSLDTKRAERDRVNGVMKYFEKEGYTEAMLEKLKFQPLEDVDKAIDELKVEKGVILKNPEKAKEDKLTAIKEKGRKIVEEIRKLNESREKEYKDWKKQKDEYDNAIKPVTNITDSLNAEIIPDDFKDDIYALIQKWSLSIQEEFKALDKDKTEPVVLEIVDGRVEVYEDTVIPKEYKELMSKKAEIGKEYRTEKETPIDLSKVDTKDVDTKLDAKLAERERIDASNDVYNRYQAWKSWIEARGLWEKEIETLRKLYAKIDTGVKGLRIDISDENDSHLWLTYNGFHSPEVFQNKKKEYRRLHTYSASQFAIIGILMQSALLDKKDKTARFVVLDNYNMTRESKQLLEDVCREKDVKLLLTRTDDRYDLDKLGAGEVVIDGGELLLGNHGE